MSDFDNYMQSVLAGLHDPQQPFSLTQGAPQGVSGTVLSQDPNYSPASPMLAQPPAAPVADTPPPPSNVLALASMAHQADPQQPMTAAGAAAAQPRRRMSILDTIGRVSDVLARTGGATAQYQPNLDAALGRTQADEDRQRGIVTGNLANDRTRQEIASGNVIQAKNTADTQKTLQELNAGRYGAALRGVQAIQKAGGDVASVWPLLAKQAGVSDEDTQRIGSIIGSNPGAIDGLAAEYEKVKSGGGSGEFGLNPFIATDSRGNSIAYQLGKDGTMKKVELPDGFSPSSSVTAVDTGGQHVVVDKRTGLPMRILPNSVSPDKAAQLGYERGKDADKATKDKPAAGDPFGTYRTARTGLQNLVKSMDDLTNDAGLANATGTTGALTRHLPAGMGGADAQRILAKIEALKGRAIPSALNTMRGADGKLGFRPSQVEVLGDAKGLTGALDSLGQSHGDYVGSIQRNRQLIIDQIHRLDEDAQRNGYVARSADGRLAPAARVPAAGPRPTLSAKPRPGAAPSVSNW